MDTNDNKSKEIKSDSDRPVHIVRRGAIAASIWQRLTPTGVAYYEYTLSRSWKSKNAGRQGYSSSFFSRNVGELNEVVNEATRWIAIREQAAHAEDKPVVINDDAVGV